MNKVILSLAFGLSAISGCTRDPHGSSEVGSTAPDSLARARQDSINRTLPGYVVDSILPVEEELRRFRAAVGSDSIAGFETSARSRDALVNQIVSELEKSDTTGLKALLINAHEFAWLVYPESPYTKPPYTQAPGLVWNQIENPSASGFVRLVRRLGGKELQYGGYSCSARAEHQGRNRIWTSCMVSVAEPGEQTRARHLFGSIIERDGRFKLVSFASEF